MGNWFQDGAPLTTVSLDNRGLQYGDGLFETIAIRAAQPRLWPYHLDRLQHGCERLCLAMPDRDELTAQLQDALQQCDVPLQYCVVKVILTAGAGKRGYGRSRVSDPTIVIGVFPTKPQPLHHYSTGIDTTLCATRLASGSATAGLKTLNRLEQVLARSEFSERKITEGFTMDADDNIICGTMSNVFFVVDDAVFTPPLEGSGVAGVMRRHIIETLSDNDVTVCQKPLAADLLRDVAEVFVANSQFGVLPVKSCDAIRWPVGKVTQNVMAVLADNGIAECRL